jgi:hypothetical protein
MAQQGAAIADIQDVLGHESDKMAGHYAGEARKFAAARTDEQVQFRGSATRIRSWNLPAKLDGSTLLLKSHQLSAAAIFENIATLAASPSATSPHACPRPTNAR